VPRLPRSAAMSKLSRRNFVSPCSSTAIYSHTVTLHTFPTRTYSELHRGSLEAADGFASASMHCIVVDTDRHGRRLQGIVDLVSWLPRLPWTGASQPMKMRGEISLYFFLGLLSPPPSLAAALACGISSIQVRGSSSVETWESGASQPSSERGRSRDRHKQHCRNLLHMHMPRPHVPSRTAMFTGFKSTHSNPATRQSWSLSSIALCRLTSPAAPWRPPRGA